MRQRKTEMNPRTSEPTKYHHPLRHYAELYNRSLSSIKRYARANAPLDDPETMPYYLALQKDTGRAGVRLNKSPAKLAPPVGSRRFLNTLGEMSGLIDKLLALNASLEKGDNVPLMIKWGAERFAHTLTDLSDLFVYRFDDEDDEELSAAVIGTDLV